MDWNFMPDGLLIKVVVSVVAIAIFGPLYLLGKLFPSSDYWEKQNVACYNPNLFQRFYNYFIINLETHTEEIQRFKKYGDMYGRYDAACPVLTVAEPKLLKTLVVSNARIFANRRYFRLGNEITDNFLSALEDGDWKRVRSCMSPCFTPAKLKRMRRQTQGCIAVVLASLNVHAENNTSVDTKRIFGSYALDMIATCAFGSKINSLESPNDPFVKYAKEFSSPTKLFEQLILKAPFLLRCFHIPLFSKAASNYFKTFTLDVIERRKKEEVKKDDFLASLLEYRRRGEEAVAEAAAAAAATARAAPAAEAAPAGAADAPPVAAGSPRVAQAPTKNYLTDQEMISQCVVFFFAGYDTITSLLQVIAHHLAQDYRIQDKLYEEIKELYEEIGDELATMEHFSRLPYLNAVVDEGLRLTSSCIRMERTAREDYHNKEEKLRIKKGALISIPFYAIHHNEKYFPEPFKFDPERFLNGSVIGDRFIPFGLGPRMCVGKMFALMETKLLLIEIIRKFRFVPINEGPCEMRSRLGQLLPKGVFLKVQHRR